MGFFGTVFAIVIAFSIIDWLKEGQGQPAAKAKQPQRIFTANGWKVIR